jgi:ferredoxin--NADP+ reductase
MDIVGLTKEFDRIRQRLEAVGQKPDDLFKGITDEFTKCEPKISDTKIGFRFLASPKRVLVDASNRVRALEIEETRLEPKGEDTAAVGLKQFYEFPVDSVIFAVGDRVDETVGLPYKGGVFVTNPNKTINDPDDSLFQAYDEASGKIVEGVFLTGWARKASEGLVGVAKRDGEWCAEVVTRYLEAKSSLSKGTADEILRKLHRILKERGTHVVDVKGLRTLESTEKEHNGPGDCIGEFKFTTNNDMLTAIEKRAGKPHASAAS